MSLSIAELARARETTAELLDELGLEAYLFEVEAFGDQWELKVDCVVDAGNAWESTTLSIPREILLASGDAAIHRRLLADWRGRLGACKLRKS